MATLESFLEPKWKTSITKVEPNKIITRGFLQKDIIGNISFSEMVYLLLKGEMPSKNEVKMLQAILVSLCEHKSTSINIQSAKIMALAGLSLNECVAGGFLALSNQGNATGNAMELLQNGIKRHKRNIVNAAGEISDNFLNHEIIPGFGHTNYKQNLKVIKLIELAGKYKCIGLHTELLFALQKLLFKGKKVNITTSGINAAILSDMGFDHEIGSGISMIGKLPCILSFLTNK